MMDQFTAMYATGTVRYSQTSFLELATAVEVHRVDFIDKVAAHLKRGTGGAINHYTEHPALLYHNGPITAVAIRSAPRVPAGFVAAYQQFLVSRLGEWRAFVPAWSGIQVQRQWLSDLLRLGHSHTVYLPEWDAKLLVPLCEHYGVHVSCSGREELLQAGYWLPQPLKIPPPFTLLTIGQNYVVARDFRVSTMR